MKLRRLLRENAEGSGHDQLICQFSSIGCLGKRDAWLEAEFQRSLSAARSPGPLLHMGVIYPTVEDVRNSIEGYQAGGSLPFSERLFCLSVCWDEFV